MIAIYGIIFWLSHQRRLPGPEDSLWRFIWFKTAHLMVYASMGWFMYRAWRESLPKKSWLFVLTISAISAILLAASDEWQQSFVPGRTATLRDVGIDSFGIGAALLLQRRYNQFRSPKNSV